MNRRPFGFKYLIFAVAFCVVFVVSYWYLLNYSPPVLEFSSVRLVKLINNKDGRVHKLIPEYNGPLNYAYKKRATGSKSFMSGGIHGAFRAIDGDIRGTLAETESLKQPYIDVDLNSVVNITTVRIYNRDDDFANRIVPFKIFLGRTPFKQKDETLNNANSVALASIEYTETKNNYTWVLDPPVPARYVRVQLVHNNSLHIYELEVYDKIISDDYRFSPHYVQYRAEPPAVPLPTTFPAFLALSGQILNMAKPKRVFTANGTEVTAENFAQTLFVSQTSTAQIPDLYISDGTNFVGEVQVCIVFLCTDGSGYNTNSDYIGEVMANLEVLSSNFFTVYQYDVVIFYSWADPTAIKANKDRVRTKFPYLTVRFVDVSHLFPPTLPQHLIDNNVNMTLFQQGSDCAPGNHWKLNYLHMGRFWSTQLWLQPILLDYDLIWRLDADATVDIPIKENDLNFLRDMWSKNGVLGYWERIRDPGDCDNEIAEAVDTFAHKKNMTYKQKKVADNTAYWGGFGVYATKFFCQDQNWLEFTRYLDSLGGHYNHRWGEQNVFPIAMSLFLERKQLYWVQEKNLKIFHDHDPTRNKA